MPVEDRCFACGRHNAGGLHLEFAVVGDHVEAVTTLGPPYDGPPGTIHGGIIITLLDEAIAQAAWRCYGVATTAELAVRFRRAAPLGAPLHISGRLIGRRLGLIAGEAEVRLADGTLVASASGKFMLLEGA